MGYWRKAKKDVEVILVAFDAAGWTVLDPPKYYTVRCPCGHHQRWIHLTPSDPDYGRNAIAWLHRQDCFAEKGGTS